MAEDLSPANAPVTGATRIETRSIDYVPRGERHGVVWRQGPFWFTGNFVLTAMLTGFIGPSLGLDVISSVVGLALGVLFGTIFMAFHANQGPRMGLPQMIQSRAQFGLRGSIVPFVVVVFVYVGFSVFNTVLCITIAQQFFPGTQVLWGAITVAISLALAIFGYDLLHLVQKYVTYVLVPLYLVLTVGALVLVHPTAQTTSQFGFTWSGFIGVFAAAAAYQISYSVYVSDYSRYLPADASAPKLITWTYVGAALSAIWIMGLGSFVAVALPGADPVAAVRSVGDLLFPGFGALALGISFIPLVTVMGVNFYGAMLTGASALDGIRPVRPTRRMRIVGLSVVAALVLTLALALPEDYLGSFNVFVVLMLLLLVPWTAVNLVDFYFVRHGHYAILHIFRRDGGIYGVWPWRGLTAYAVGVAVSIPFAVVGPFEGPVAAVLGGVDLSFLPGLVVTGVLYYVLTRSVDTSLEQEAIADSERRLGEAAGSSVASIDGAHHE